jgi:hypothetical protein
LSAMDREFRFLAFSIIDFDLSMANNLPVFSLVAMSSANNPAPQPISRTWSEGFIFSNPAAQVNRSGVFVIF